MEIKQIETREELKKLIPVLRGQDPSGWKVLKDWDLNMFRKIPCWVLFVENVPVSINFTSFGKTKRKGQGPWANWYMSFTNKSHRGLGYDKILTNYILDRAVAQGCTRMKAKAGTMSGLQQHFNRQDQLWGITEKYEVIVDTPIIDGIENEVPYYITDRTTPMVYSEIFEILKAKFGRLKLGYDL